MKTNRILILWIFVCLPLFALAERVGFYSGTFDPPHEGHADLIKRSVRELKLDKIIVVVGILQAHKPGASSYETRNEMAKAAFGKIPGVVFPNRDEQQSLSEGGISKLQQKLSSEYKKGTIYQIMGDDSFTRIEEKSDAVFPDNFVIVVSKRDPKAVVPKTFHDKTKVLELSPDYREYSSTKFRKMISQGRKPPQVSTEVYEIVQAQGLYGAKASAATSKHPNGSP